MASKGPQGPLREPFGETSPSEELLRILVVGDAASGKTALLQLLQQHATELASACIAQQEEDEAIAAAVAASGVLPSLSEIAAATVSALPEPEDRARPSLSPPPALQGYRCTCGVNVVPLRCTDTAGQTRLVEFWEVGGSSATRATRALLYAIPFDGVWLAFDSGNEATFRSLPSWLLEICMRGGVRPSEVFFLQQNTENQQQQDKLQQSIQPEKEGDRPNDVEMQSFGGSFWGWRLRCGLCPLLVVATKADRGFMGAPARLQASWGPPSSRRLWRAHECIWRDPGRVSRFLGRYYAIEQRIWQANSTAEEKDRMKQLVCSLLNNAACMETSAALGLVDVGMFFAFLSKCVAYKNAASL